MRVSIAPPCWVLYSVKPVPFKPLILVQFLCRDEVYDLCFPILEFHLIVEENDKLELIAHIHKIPSPLIGVVVKVT